MSDTAPRTPVGVVRVEAVIRELAFHNGRRLTRAQYKQLDDAGSFVDWWTGDFVLRPVARTNVHEFCRGVSDDDDHVHAICVRDGALVRADALRCDAAEEVWNVQCVTEDLLLSALLAEASRGELRTKIQDGETRGDEQIVKTIFVSACGWRTAYDAGKKDHQLIADAKNALPAEAEWQLATVAKAAARSRELWESHAEWFDSDLLLPEDRGTPLGEWPPAPTRVAAALVAVRRREIALGEAGKAAFAAARAIPLVVL